MQRIAQENQPRQITHARRRNLRSDSPAHRLPANRELVSLELLVRANRLNHRSPTFFQLVVAVGHPAAVFGVEEVERDRIDSAQRKLVRKLHHEPAHLARARPVTEYQRDARRFFAAAGYRIAVTL